MSFTYNGTEVQGVTYNGAEVQSITYNGVEVWSAVPSDLSKATPAQIKQAVQKGIAANLWDVGDKIGIVLNGTVGKLTFNNETFYASILGFDHNKDVESGGNHNVHFIFGKTADNVDICFVDSGYRSRQSGANYFHHHTSDTNRKGWSESDLRTICSAFLSSMPAEWQAVIGSSTKYSDNVGNGYSADINVTATQDKVFLLAEFEVFGVRSQANSAEQNYQQQYDYYKNGNSKKRYKHNDTSTSATWWLRSPIVALNDSFCSVEANYSESPSHSEGIRSFGFAPGFAIF